MTRAKKSISEITRRFVSFAVKIGISAGLIFWLFKQNRLDFASFNNLRFDMDTVLFLLGGSVSVFCGLLLLGWRLWLLLRFNGFSVTYRKVLNITLVGSFLGAILPGLVGGDAVKAVYLCSNVSERRMDALASVLVDRILGLYSLLVLGTLVLCIARASNGVHLNTRVLLIAPTAVVLFGLGLFLFAWDGFFNMHIIQSLYSVVPKKIQNLLTTLRNHLKAPKLIIIVMVLSLFNHAFVVISFVVAAALLNDGIPIIAHFILNPLAMAMNAIPLTPGGLGMAEGAFSFLFQAAGSPNGAMVGLIGRFIQYSVFILSGSIALSLLRMRSRILTVDKECSKLAEA